MRLGADPAGAGMNYGKPQLLTDVFELPPRKAPKPPKARNPPVRNLPPKSKVRKPRKNATPKTPKPRPRTQLTPAEIETKREERLQYDRQRSQNPQRREHHRLHAQESRRKAKELGLCKSCPNPAKPGQTRCPTCAEKHRESNRRSNAKRKDMG